MPNIYTDPEAFGLKAFGDVDFSSGSYEFNRLVVWTDQAGQFVYAEDRGCSCPTPFESIDLRNAIHATPHEIAARLQAKDKEREDTYGGPENDPKDGHDAMVDLIGRLMASRPAVTAAVKVLGYALVQIDTSDRQPRMDFYGPLFTTVQEARDDPASQVSDRVVAVCEVPE